jgi:hypothetical protein
MHLAVFSCHPAHCGSARPSSSFVDFVDFADFADLADLAGFADIG